MDWNLVIIAGGFVAFMYAFIIRPQQQRQKQMRQLMESLAVGDDVVTIGGLHGRIKSIDGEDVTLRVAEGCDVVYEKAAIGRRIEPEDAEEVDAK